MANHGERTATNRTVPDELELRQSGVQPVAGPTVAELRDRYTVLVAAREYAPERLTTRALYIFNLHEVIALRHGCDPEEMYMPTVRGEMMREELRTAVPDWFTE